MNVSFTPPDNADGEGDHEGEASQEPYHSPLGMVAQQPLLNSFVRSLERSRATILAEPQGNHELHFSRKNITAVRASFAGMIRQGEQRLHKLCELLCSTYLSSVQLQSVVIGEVISTKERFTLTQSITPQDLYSTTDLDLGTRQLQKLRVNDGKEWSAATLVANVVEYQPLEVNALGIHKIVSRIKAEEELWNKVVDELFDLDSLVRRDKQIRHLSRFVKDVFGIKIVTSTLTELAKVQQALEHQRWDEATLSKLDIPYSEHTASLTFIEKKSYLGAHDRKRSGWEAMKSVVEWGEKVIEIQIQPLGKFMREREFLTRESHSGFKSKREEVRNTVAEQLPLFGFFRDLLRWLFLNASEPPPVFPGVRIVVEE